MKRAIITGASEGLGFETSKILIEKGWEVIGLSRSKPSLELTHIETDLTDEKSIAEAIKEIKINHSEFDVLINCAGILSIQELQKVEYSDVEKLFKVNVLGPIALTTGLMELIKSNKADIVNVGSTIGFKGYEGQLAYGSSKWAVRGINTNLQTELKGTPSRVIGFNPGGFKSRIFEKATGIKSDLSAFMEADEVAKFLVSTIELPKNMEVSEVVLNRK